MKRQVITQLTTAERLTLLEQIFAPQGERSCVEFASCVLSNMVFMFDFADVNLVEMKWSGGDGDFEEIIGKVNHLLSPEAEQKLGLGVPYFVHAILPQAHTLTQNITRWLQHDESVAMVHFVTSSDTDDITIRVTFIKNEIDDKIIDEIEKDNRILK